MTGTRTFIHRACAVKRINIRISSAFDGLVLDLLHTAEIPLIVAALAKVGPMLLHDLHAIDSLIDKRILGREDLVQNSIDEDGRDFEDN